MDVQSIKTGTIVFMDVEGTAEYPCEVGMVAVDAESRQHYTFHRVIRQGAFSPRHYDAGYCHCMPKNCLLEFGHTLSDVQTSMIQFFEESVYPIYLFGHGTDMTRDELLKMFPDVNWQQRNMIFRQVALPCWIERHDLPCHRAAIGLKENRLGQYQATFTCRLKSVHCAPFKSGKRSTLSTTLKRVYGFHCALVDAFELAFYTK